MPLSCLEIQLMVNGRLFSLPEDHVVIFNHIEGCSHCQGLSHLKELCQFGHQEEI